MHVLNKFKTVIMITKMVLQFRNQTWNQNDA